MGVLDRTVPAAEPVAEAPSLVTRLHGWVVTVDHKRLGIMYIVSGILFLLVAGSMATTIRLQLVVPNNHLVPPQVFNRLMTMHGTTMIFLVAIPILFGFGNYLIPLMLGARDLAFPRLNAFGFWLFLFGALLLYFSYIAGDGLSGAARRPMSAGSPTRRSPSVPSRVGAAPTTGSSASRWPGSEPPPPRSTCSPPRHRCAARA